MQSERKLPLHLAVQIAAEAHVCLKTVYKAAAGKHVRGYSGARARAALMKRGLLPTVSESPPADGKAADSD